jgi:citrate lyase beta subunit
MADATEVSTEPRTSLSSDVLAPIAERLRPAHAELARRYPGDSGLRQPVHTVYGGAQLFTAETASKLGEVARRTLEEYAPDFVTLARAVGMPGADRLAEIGGLDAALANEPARVRRERPDAWLAHAVYTRVRDKLASVPVEDFRIDYEDGYGVRPDAEEDAHAAAGAREVARGMRERTLPPFIGIRVKPLTAELHARSLRTLDIFLTTLVGEAGHLPERFLLTLPKIQAPEQVTAFAEVLGHLEGRLHLENRSLRFEAMVETPQNVVDASGRTMLPSLIDAAQGRLVAAHIGTYDYTASLNITASYQRMRHVVCDFLRSVVQLSVAGTGIFISDGSTNVMPVPIHRAFEGKALTDRQTAENRASVHKAWRMHYEDVRHSLASGFYQGWDLHPAQLVTRYAAVYAFFLAGVDAQAARLKNFVEKAAQATLVGDVFDDAATGQGLLNFFIRAINCGALSEEEAVAMTGVTLEELRTRSFVKILEGRRK